ncbi:bile acid:sodium symporter family protein [Pedobacter frigiditerrae]|uniref:Bile acid:sodium symporter family protein n=1 Tax=Pedobacter frigiditerrae TaxID=2530452 RepID=A0A4R0MPD9_9SPHI|nr:bile acid:sodium symporter family protein [Pedobacter frigiditerrae]TCC88698.1 bile acid:sodium symporter family protein [Pedobacter frigiditerrae]
MILKRVFLVATLILLVVALYLFASDQNIEAGLILTAFWLFLSGYMVQTKALGKFAYTVIILASVSVSMTFPQYFIQLGDFHLKKLIVPLLQLITFGVGCTMGWHDLSGVLKMPKAVLVGVLCHYTIMPFVGFAIAKMFGFPPEIAAGVVLVGCMPSGLASNVIAFIAKANLPLSVTITAVSTLLAPLMTPLLMKLLGGQFVPVSFLDMFIDILKLVIIPIFLGVFINHFFHKKALWIDKVMPKISMAGIACIIIIITAAGRDNMLHVGMALVFAMFLHMTIGVLLGYWGGRLFGLSKLNSRTIAIEVGMQNGGLASGIAVQMGKIATVGLAPAVNGPIMNTTFSLIATWWGSKPPEKELKSADDI